MNLKYPMPLIAGLAVALQLVTPPALAEVKKYSLSEFVEVNVDSGFQQRDIKQAVLRLNFPKDIELVGQAVNYSLLQTGYSLDRIDNLQPEVLKQLVNPLPNVHREFIDVTLENVLTTLIGPAYSVMYDEYQRKITIQPIYRTTLNN